MDHDHTGPILQRLLASATRKGFEVGGDRLKTSPRGYAADHPRIDLLRHRALVVGRSLGFEPVIHTPEVLEVIRADWRALRPLVSWLGDHTAPRVGL